MPKILEAAGEARPAVWLIRELGRRLGLDPDFYPWPSDEALLDAMLDHPATGHASVAALRGDGGIRALNVSHVAHPDLRFPTPSRKVEFYSERAASLGLPALPVYEPLPPAGRYPLAFRQGRTLTQFHGFYDHGLALPTLARLDPEPSLWIAPADAAVRGVGDGAWIRIWNDRGEFEARARVTERVPPGTVWMRDGWTGLNRLTSGAPSLPDEAVDLFGFSAGQSAFDATVEVAPSGSGSSAAPR
jgi:anaerobic selenocysteine-containing dehydrogenase